MNFRTRVEQPKMRKEILHSERIMIFGSCFAENIGEQLKDNKFRCDVNPFGVLYNPLSIANALRQIMAGKVFRKEDLFCSNGLWHSWMHHGSFSGSTSEECLERVNERLKFASGTFESLDWLIVTWGSSYVYIHHETNEVVGNCHKQSDKLFRRLKLNVDTIVEDWKSLLSDLKKKNPRLKVLFTVSPIRHSKDGMHGNQLSKATLLLAADELCRICADCFYFPSYEILLDELRDYRFYADDMLHPSPLAIQYVWKCFSDCYFSENTRQIFQEWEEIKRGLEHKPNHPDSESYRNFLSQIVLKITRIKEKFPYLEVQKEIKLCESRLKK